MTEKKVYPKTLKPTSKAAYKLVDLEGLDRETRNSIIEDAQLGGGTYGIRVVEESVNGPARAPIYGYYMGTADEERWEEAKAELGIDPLTVEASDEEKLREAANNRATEEAEKASAAEDAEVALIVKDGQTEEIEQPAPAKKTTNKAPK